NFPGNGHRPGGVGRGRAVHPDRDDALLARCHREGLLQRLTSASALAADRVGQPRGNPERGCELPFGRRFVHVRDRLQCEEVRFRLGEDLHARAVEIAQLPRRQPVAAAVLGAVGQHRAVRTHRSRHVALRSTSGGAPGEDDAAPHQLRGFLVPDAVRGEAGKARLIAGRGGHHGSGSEERLVRCGDLIWTVGEQARRPQRVVQVVATGFQLGGQTAVEHQHTTGNGAHPFRLGQGGGPPVVPVDPQKGQGGGRNTGPGRAGALPPRPPLSSQSRTGYCGSGTRGDSRPSMKIACQIMNTSSAHSRRLWSRTPDRCSSSSCSTAPRSSRWSVCDCWMMLRAQSCISSLSQCRIGTGKPSLRRLITWGGTTCCSACRSAYLVVSLVIFCSNGTVLATRKTSASRNGTRSSSEFAMVILSALTRMSPRSQVNRSTCCIRVTGSQPTDCRYGSAVMSLCETPGSKARITERSWSSRKMRALPE